MERPLIGEVVVLSFPFSDLSATKQRPAVVMGVALNDDLILSQITSKPPRASYEVALAPTDVVLGGLRVASTICPGKLFTLNERLITRKLGMHTVEKLTAVRVALRQLLNL